MNEPEHHVMQLAATHSSGAEEWYCPACGRRFLMHWPPAYQKLILERGDEHAIHDGSKGGLELSNFHVAEVAEDAPGREVSASPWEEWLGEIDFGEEWNGENE